MRSSQVVSGLALCASVFIAGCSGPDHGVETARTSTLSQQLSTVVDVPFPPELISGGYAICATGSLKINDRATVKRPDGTFAPIMSMGTATTEIGADAKTGAVWSKGPVFLRERSQVQGSLLTGGTLSTQNGTMVTGTVTQNANLQIPNMVTLRVTLPSPGASVSLEPNQSRDLGPGSYGAISVKSGATLRLVPGSYYVTSLTLEPSSKITFSSENGPVQLFIRDTYIHRGTITDTASASPRILLAYLGTAMIPVEAPLSGILLAPNAAVQLASVTAAHNAELLAKDVQLFEGASFVFNRFVPLSGEEAFRNVVLGLGKAAKLLPEIWDVDPISKLNLSNLELSGNLDILAARLRTAGFSDAAVNSVQRLGQIANHDGASAAIIQQRVKQALTAGRSTGGNALVRIIAQLDAGFLPKLGLDLQSGNRPVIDADLRSAFDVILRRIRFTPGITQPFVAPTPALPFIDVAAAPPNYPFTATPEFETDFSRGVVLDFDVAIEFEVAVAVAVAAVAVLVLSPTDTSGLRFDTFVDNIAPRFANRPQVLQAFL